MGAFNRDQKLFEMPRTESAKDKDIITYWDKPVIVYPEKDNKDIFYVSSERVEYQRLNRRKYLNSFKNDVGILAIAKKLAKQNESIFDGRFASKNGQGKILDVRNLPKDGEQLNKLMNLKSHIWAKLPEDMKGGLSFEEFVSSFDNSKLTSYIEGRKAKIVAKKGVKVGE